MNEVAELELPTQENVQADLRTVFQGAVRLALETVLEEVVRDMIGARRWQRLGSRKDLRNGTYLRRLLTTMGAIDLAVPRTRENGSPIDVVGRYRRRAAEVDAGIVSAYVSGASTRDVGRITEALMGEQVSRSTVSRVTKTLDEKVNELRKAPIAGPIPYLFLDATFLDARWARTVENVSALVAYGIGLDGKRQLLAVTIGAEESEDSWSDLLAQLTERGLSGVHLVVADAHAGLAKAVRKHIPEAPLQRCTVHLQRNVLAKAPQRLRARLAKAVTHVFEAPSKAEAKKRVEALAAGLGRQVPEAIACLEAGFEAATHFYAFPREHWHRIRSTNGLERLHGEIKRRTRAVGAFPDRASALRLVTAVALQVTAIWSDRRYLDMDLLPESMQFAA
ncbi:IS256-like element ISAnsp14 family transposase [Anaeromyxobacter sp. Fw109-5]|uniref:IS256-like element ISAnsp14 family transposase n=1 Tax=Anaeromyxobacter sp. (strain Fw109-5) TaxID=404589 RepID=UPI0000ED803F|nr:IS256-like element ISAnsp14 family transposase [Anaeromyxobacter sp. Fw109-5]ABS25284.1 transposase mutator type [Anaeromyxobacter sp. Fw109-5]